MQDGEIAYWLADLNDFRQRAHLKEAALLPTFSPPLIAAPEVTAAVAERKAEFAPNKKEGAVSNNRRQQ